MLNSQFMTALAKLESVAATSAEQETINAVRGRYVAKFGTEHPYVAALNKLESVAATDAEKAEINKIRGKFGLFEMTGDTNKQNPELLKYADDEYSAYGDDNDPDDLPMSEEDRLSKRYGTPMSVVGEEIVRNIDPNVRKDEDAEDEEERRIQDFNERWKWNDNDDNEVINSFNDFWLMELSNSRKKEYIYEFIIDNTIKYIKQYPCELKDLLNELDNDDFNLCACRALESHIIKEVPVKYIKKTPKVVNGKQLLTNKMHTVYVLAIPVGDNEYFMPEINIQSMLTNGDTDRYKFDHSKHFYSDETPWFYENVANGKTNVLVNILLDSDTFLDSVDNMVQKRKSMLGTGLDIDGAYGTISPDTKTPEEAYSDFAESHAYATDEEDPYSKYN